MKKALFTTYVFLFVFGIDINANANNINISDEIYHTFSPYYSHPVIYSITYNQHGRILTTSDGIFYLGNSNDVIHKFSNGKRYGYWEGSYDWITIYIGSDTYQFYY
jgi:hypothetical protein